MSRNSSRRGWPETWTRWSRSVMTSMPCVDQAVDDGADRLLVAGDGARGEDHAVAPVQRHLADGRHWRCAPAPRAARPGCRCTAPAPCPAEDGRRHRRRGNSARRRDSRSRARPAPRAPWRGRPPRPRGRRPSRHRRRPCSRATLEAKVVTATRPLAAFTSSAMVLATSASEGERPSRTALVESPISASTPASPSSRSRRSSVGAPDDRRRIDLPVAGVQHGADLGVDRQRMRFRNRMRDRNELDVERADIDAAARRHHRHRDFRRIALGGAFGLEQRGAELASRRSGISASARGR